MPAKNGSGGGSNRRNSGRRAARQPGSQAASFFLLTSSSLGCPSGGTACSEQGFSPQLILSGNALKDTPRCVSRVIPALTRCHKINQHTWFKDVFSSANLPHCVEWISTPFGMSVWLDKATVLLKNSSSLHDRTSDM